MNPRALARLLRSAADIFSVASAGLAQNTKPKAIAAQTATFLSNFDTPVLTVSIPFLLLIIKADPYLPDRTTASHPGCPGRCFSFTGDLRLAHLCHGFEEFLAVAAVDHPRGPNE